MFTHTILSVLLAAASLASASLDHDIRHIESQHKKRASSLIRRNANGKRCRVKVQPAFPSAKPTHATSTKASPTTTSKAEATSPASTGHANGVIKVVSPQCGESGGSVDTTATNGPNGKLAWLNCNIATDGGWAPPPIKVSDLITQDLASFKSSTFSACASYMDLFYKYGSQYNLPPILIASIAMQESTCNPNTTGGGNEQGLMQISQDKCGGAPNGNCKDAEFNIKTGAKYFADTLASNDGNVLITMGMYNGWFKGMTVGQATAAASTSCCLCQKNLDYPHQVFNGWLQGKNPYDTKMGQYFNLNRCH